MLIRKLNDMEKRKDIENIILTLDLILKVTMDKSKHDILKILVNDYLQKHYPF